LQTHTLRLRQIKRQHVHAAQLIQNQFIDALAAAAGQIIFRKLQRTHNQFAQQRRNLHNLTASGQIGARQRIDEQRARGDLTGYLQRMAGKGRQPDAAARRHDPAALRGIDAHDAAQGVDQLRAAMMVPGFAVTVRVIMRIRHQRPGGKIKSQPRRHRYPFR